MNTVATLRSLHQAKRFSEMEALAERAAHDAGNDGALWNLLGVARHAQGKDGLDAFRRATACNPRDVDFQRNLAAALAGGHAYAEALAAYGAAREISPASTAVLAGGAACLQQLGRHADALPWFEALLHAEPANAEAWSNLGHALFALAQFERAAACFSRFAALRPSHPDGYILLGNALRKLGKPAEAAGHYRQALQLRPAGAATCCSLGNALASLGYPGDAEAAFLAALSIDPSCAPAANDLGALYSACGRHGDALAHYEFASRLLPGNADVLYNVGDAQRRLEQADRAAATLERVIALAPNHHLAWNSLGMACTHMQQYDKAMQCFSACLRIEPGYAAAHGNRAVTLAGLNRFAEAFEACSRAIELDPRNSNHFSNRAHALFRLGRFNEALHDAETALTVRPGDREAQMHRVDALSCLGRKPEAMALLDAALAMAPGDKRMRFLASQHFLRDGDYASGFALYEARRHVPPYKYLWESVAGRRWSGAENLAGKSLLLYAEQGLGDTIQMLRFLPLAASRAAAVVLRISRSVAPLLEKVPPNVRVVIDGTDEPALQVDHVCSLMSLPHALRISLGNIPEPRGCLSIPARKLSQWQVPPGKTARKRIGIAWSGNPYFPMDHWRSMPPALLLSAFDGLGDVELVALQKEIRPADLPALDAASVRHFGQQMHDLADTAAIIDGLDLVISVDTMAAHLAGALGKETWVLLPFVGDWRWLAGTGRSPWYPSLRLFRQAAPGQWQDVLEKAGAALRDAS